MSDRPVYIPSRKRKQKQQRFHGAFTGGFSAGHFNTVGTEEGWEPKEDQQQVSREQKPQDFMDEQDHNEWGGVKSVREEYAAASNRTSTTPASLKNDSMMLADLVRPPAQNVGHRLLRILGWRDGSTAYVPQDDTAATLLKPAEQSIEAVLSSRRLKKIQLQQIRVKLPPPKLDTCGLGYERYHNAPEFRAHRERRRKEAQERAKAVTASSAENRNVYRLSDLLDKNEEGEERQQTRRNRNAEEDDDPLVTYETEQSFVGTKTVGGFALREDDDDVYDDNFKQSKINREEYDTVVYEHASDDDEDEDTKKSIKTGEDFGSVFASWANTSKTTTSGDKSTAGITSDGRPPLPGFFLGSSSSSKTSKRFPGPDIPTFYEPKRHVFGDDEHAGAWKDELHDSRMELVEQKRKAIQAERKADMDKKEKERDSGPMAGTAFAGLAAAMKNRFTSSAPDSSAENGGTPATIGLQPGRTRASSPPTSVPVKDTEPKPITIQRTTMTFVPESLLCKRFHVVVPAHAKPTVGGNKKVAEPKGEHAYFEREILSKAAGSSTALSSRKKTDTKQPAMSIQEQVLGSEQSQVEPADTRPSMKVLESIFDSGSEDSESEEEKDVVDVAVTAGPQDQLSGSVHVQVAASVPEGIPDGILAPAAELPPVSSTSDTRRDDSKQESESRKDRRHRSKADNYERKRRRRSRSRSPSSSPERAKKKRSRKREEKKKRKKRHKSSRRSKSD